MASELQDLRKGEVCVIIGNGPSLNQVPDGFLAKYLTFGANRIYLKMQPTFYVCINPLVVLQYADEINQVNAVRKFICQAESNRIKDCISLVDQPQRYFSRDPLSGVHGGFTVTYVSMQLAYAMGFRVALLVGVDHRYSYKGAPNQENLLEGKDPNHFDPDYFKDALWNNPDLEQSEVSYRMAKTVWEFDGRQIINLGPDSALEVFERGRMEDW